MSNLIINNPFGITERKGIPVVSSRYVAETFGKQHAHVLRDIKIITESKSGLSAEFSSLNFEESNYKDSTGRRLLEYLLTRDGFTILAMGFSGKKAMKFKEDYINAFNQMESFIKNLLEAKLDFPEFTDAIMATHEEPKSYHFSNELNMINKIVTGMDAKHFKELKGIDPTVKSIRPYLEPNQLEAVRSLQRIDIGLIVSMQGYEQRKATLEKQYYRIQQKALTA